MVKDIKENHIYVVRYQTHNYYFLDEELFTGKNKDEVRENFSKKYPDREILRISALNEDWKVFSVKSSNSIIYSLILGEFLKVKNPISWWSRY